MPLIHGKSKKSFAHNVETEMDAGKPQKQSLAIAYNIMRKNRAKKMADGGMADGQHEHASEPTKHDMSEHMMSKGGIMMRPKSMADMIHSKRMAKGGMADCYDDGGVVAPETAVERGQKSMRKAFNFAEGGDVDEDTEPDYSAHDNDFVGDSPDVPVEHIPVMDYPDPDGEEDTEGMSDPKSKRRGVLIQIMHGLHKDHYGA